MKLIELGLDFIKKNKYSKIIFLREDKFEDLVIEMLKFLDELKVLEASFWGVNIKKIKNNEEEIIEDTNHLIYLISRNKTSNLDKVFKQKNLKDFFRDLNLLVDDFKNLKKKIMKRDKLKNLITKLSIKLVDKNHFNDLENIFILEKQLYSVLDNQEKEFKELLFNASKLKLNLDSDLKNEKFIQILKEIRVILSGHLDCHKLWEEERYGFSNTSNIIFSLIKNLNNLKSKYSKGEIKNSI